MTSVLNLPKIDLSKLDVSKIDLSKLDLTAIRQSLPDLPSVDTDQVVEVLRDAAYIAIGFGVITVQQAQVRRRELSGRLDQVQQAVHSAGQQLVGLVRQAA
jgi:hypothetical protein